MISRRPPVLAHERFLADRENFAGLDHERCEESGGGWRDKSLWLWRLEDV